MKLVHYRLAGAYIIEQKKRHAAHIQAMGQRKTVAELSSIRDALPRHLLGLVGKSETPQAHGVIALRADPGIVSAKIIGVVAMTLPVVETDNLLRCLPHAGEIRLPHQRRYPRVVRFDQKVGVVEFARDGDKLIGKRRRLRRAA